MLNKRWKSKKVIAAASDLPDDLVVEILSLVPFKSFCRFKCVCKAWLAFSSDPHYHHKLPKIPTALLYKGHDRYHDINLSSNGEKIDGTLSFTRQHKQLEFVDYCNGLVLCEYMNVYTSSCICRFIVCNPTTREWRKLPVPHTHDHPYVHPDDSCFRYTTLLAFDPSSSAQFYVFRFHEKFDKFDKSRSLGICQVEVFSSSLSTWFVDDSLCWDRDASGWNPIILTGKSHYFIGGVLHLQTSSHNILVVEGLEAMSSRMPPHHFTIKPPHDDCHLKVGCFGQSSGLLQCAFQEEGGRTITIFSLHSYRPCKWSLKHRLCMRDALGRDDFIRSGDSWPLFCNYKIIALDMEKGVLLLVDANLMKLLSYNINTGKLSGIKNGELNMPYEYYYYYVACYSKLPRMSPLCGELSSK